MSKNLIRASVCALLLTACHTEPAVEHYINVSGEIAGAQGKYLKIIDMTQMGLKPDSILIDENGQFGFSQKSVEPKDFVLFIEPENNIRLLPSPDESVVVSASYPNLVESYKVSGSIESERLSALLKQHHLCNYVLDTLNHYYMANQLSRNLNKIIESVRPHQGGTCTQTFSTRFRRVSDFLTINDGKDEETQGKIPRYAGITPQNVYS